jgi:isopenicillin N synthase-like dioxygenase
LSETAKGHQKKDLKEFYHLYFPHGRYPKEISDVTLKNFERQFDMGKTLLKWIEAYLPESIRAKLSCPLSDMVSMERTLYRILYYPPLTGQEEPGAVRAAPHEDINLITVLPAATNPGLQVKNKKGEWLNVKVDPESVVINIGDMLQEATDGYYISTTHQVINPTGEEAKKPRLSMPQFIHAGAKVKLSPRHTAESYLNERLRELGLM